MKKGPTPQIPLLATNRSKTASASSNVKAAENIAVAAIRSQAHQPSRHRQPRKAPGDAMRSTPFHVGLSVTFSPRFPQVLENALILTRTEHGVVKADILPRVFVDADIHQAGVLIALELIDRVVHQRTVEQP